ncbi:MAG: energy transducer TonB [Saprospiraceae bacterium]|nr:energy transducer TonB [Saprospiraceae bacterium]
MKKQSFKLVLLISLLSVWIFGACNSDKKPDADGTAMENAVDTTSHMATDMPAEDDHYDFSYNYVEDDVAFEKAKAADAKKASTPPKLKVKDTPVIYTISQTERPPLFSAECLTAKNPQRCSNNALAAWAEKSVKYPEADLAEGSDGLEYVTFVINKRGEVTAINRVETKQEACEGCSKAVLDAVLDMPDWQPAMLGGNPVNVVVTLPVRFKVL